MFFVFFFRHCLETTENQLKSRSFISIYIYRQIRVNKFLINSVEHFDNVFGKIFQNQVCLNEFVLSYSQYLFKNESEIKFGDEFKLIFS